MELVTLTRSALGKVDAWSARAKEYAQGERLVQRQRFKLPAEWMWASLVEGEWSAFEQILARRA